MKEMAFTYFDLIYQKLDTADEDLATFQIMLRDVYIIKVLCICLEEWDYTADVEISLRCMMITHIKRIWLKDTNKSTEDHFEEAWPEEYIEDFDPLTFGLEGKIHQSKTLIEEWCQISRHSSKSSTNNSIMNDCRNVYSLLWLIQNDEIVSFKNQLDILKGKLDFVNNSFYRVHKCTDSNELLEYRNFVHAFSESVLCLVCMYWAKEGNEEEIATEMNIALFDMFHKIKPFAAYVTASYFGVLKSDGWLESRDNFDYEALEVAEITASFVDLFFEHTILEDVYLILRERLIVLFTFLANAPAQEEEYVIRNQIYALFHEDSYLLLPINEMKEDDLSNKKMLLSDCIIKIDILTAVIIQFNCRPADSWNRLEVEKNNIIFASLEREIYAIHITKSRSDFGDLCIREIRFLRLFFKCFETWDGRDEETSVQLHSVVTSLQRIWGQEYDMVLLLGRLYSIRKRDCADWEHLLDLELKEKLHMSKQEINAWLVSLSHYCSFHCMPTTSNKIQNFLDSILNNMRFLVSSRPFKDVAFKKQTEILEEKLLLLNNLLRLTTNCADSKNLNEFNMLAHVFVNNAACLTYLYWAEEANDDINPAETNLMLSHMLQKIKPDTPDIAKTYIGTLKAICLQPYEFHLLEHTALNFVDFFFEDLTIPWKNDFQNLQDEVMFLLTFVHHHHIGNMKEIICNQLDVLYNDDVYDLLPFDDMKGAFSKKKVGLPDFMLNIGTESAKIRQLYCKFPDSAVFNYPRIIGQGFLDSLIQKLSNLTERLNSDQKYVSCAKFKIKTFEGELFSLTPIFNQILELKELNDTCLEVVNVLYQAEHVIGFCIIYHHLVCLYIPYLSDVIDKIKVVKKKFEKTEECNVYNSRCFPHSAGLMSTPLLRQDWASEIHGVLVGFKDDERIIIENITRGTESLDIVSIVGMGGLGKTTLAKKVYSSLFVKSHFNVYAFTCVSQDHDKRRILVTLLRDIIGIDDKTSYMMSEDDLSHKLKKCLSRKKYFIVLDDIWNINAWDEVRSSFPDDRNGSRVMFTTRSLEVAKRGQIKCTPHCLRFLTEDESWELLQKKVFHNDMPPPNLSSVAKLIAKQCGGLPLAIVVIAGLLARTKTSIWINISERVSSYLYDEGCMDVLELSYKHLPEYLKPCLIYLGAFPEDSSHTVRQVTLLWIDEGFIQESKTKSLNDVAKEYLYELVERSFIIVDKMTIGEIHTFHVHDLIHDLCQKKCRDNNFCQIGHGTAASSFTAPSIYKHYRVSVQRLSDITADVEPSLANTRSVLSFPSKYDRRFHFPLKMFRYAHVLYLGYKELQHSDFAHISSFTDLRHIAARVLEKRPIPSSICNLWNLQSLILICNSSKGVIYLPETLWRMKSLRYVKVHDCKLEVLDGYELDAYPQLDKVVRFSSPCLSTEEDVKWLLQRLPAVRELGYILDVDYKSVDSIDERVAIFDSHSKLESLKLGCRRRSPYLNNFPSTLVKLTLKKFHLPWTAISAIGELQCLRILKLRYVSFPRTTWETEDMTFPNLKYFELQGRSLELWSANTDSFPFLEELFFVDTILEELPPCFGEISSLKKITISYSPKLELSARWIQEEQLDCGNKVDIQM